MPKKLSIVRFKPKPECFDEFLRNIQDWHAQVFADGDHHLMRTDEEVVAIVVRESEQLQENMKRGWLGWIAKDHSCKNIMKLTDTRCP